MGRLGPPRDPAGAWSEGVAAANADRCTPRRRWRRTALSGPRGELSALVAAGEQDGDVQVAVVVECDRGCGDGRRGQGSPAGHGLQVPGRPAVLRTLEVEASPARLRFPRGIPGAQGAGAARC
jgi:hypothetical protein